MKFSEVTSSDADSARVEQQILELQRAQIPMADLADAPFEYLATQRATDIPQLERMLRTWKNVARDLPRYENQRIAEYLSQWCNLLSTAIRVAGESLQRMGMSTDAFLHDRNMKRDELISALDKHHASLRFQVQGLLFAAGAYQVTRSEQSMQDLALRYGERIKEWEAATEDVRRLAATLRSGVAQRAATEASAAYAEQATVHARREEFFIYAFISSLILVVAAILHVLLSPVKTDNLNELGLAAFRGLLGIVATSAIARITLKRWNLERNLRIIYDHRVAALKQYKYFEDLIKEDQHDYKERLRLKVAEIIFNDPATGYRDDSASELSVTPIVNVLDGLSARVSPAGRT